MSITGHGAVATVGGQTFTLKAEPSFLDAPLEPWRLPFLRAIADHADDDGPRLVYADELDQRGDPRGEFIRAQCELAKGERFADRARLERREAELRHRHWKAWGPDLSRPDDPTSTVGVLFGRGFVTHAFSRLENWLAVGPALLAREPMFPAAGLVVTDKRTGRFSGSPGNAWVDDGDGQLSPFGRDAAATVPDWLMAGYLHGGFCENYGGVYFYRSEQAAVASLRDGLHAWAAERAGELWAAAVAGRASA